MPILNYTTKKTLVQEFQANRLLQPALIWKGEAMHGDKA